MPKIYGDKPVPEKPVSEQKRDAQTPGKTMGVYDRPGRKRPSRGVIFAVIIAIVILIVIMMSTGFTYAKEVTIRETVPDITRTVLNAAEIEQQLLIET